jgi:hypothetical protein
VNAAIALGLPAGVARASENDYTLPTGITEESGGLEAECVWDGPLPYIDFTSVVKKTTDAAFSQLVFSGGLENTTTAVARIRPAMGFAWGRSIVALNPDDCQGNQNGLAFGGMSGGQNLLDVIDGGVWSNGCLDVDSNNANITIYNGSAEYFDPGNNLGAMTFVGGGGLSQMTNTEYRMAAADYTPLVSPLCDGSNTYDNNSFHDLGVTDHGVTTIGLAPGLYCIDDNNQGLTIGSQDVVTGTMVTIVMLDGAISVHGDATVMLSAPDKDDLESDFAPAIRGLLLYVPPSNPSCGGDDNCVTLNGNSSSFFKGTILAPDTEVRFLGDGGADLFGQIIGWDVEVRGSSESVVTYNPEAEMVLPTYLNVQK